MHQAESIRYLGEKMRSNASWRVPLWLGIAMGGAMISAPMSVAMSGERNMEILPMTAWMDEGRGV